MDPRILQEQQRQEQWAREQQAMFVLQQQQMALAHHVAMKQAGKNMVVTKAKYMEILQKRKEKLSHAAEEEEKRLDEDDKNFQYFSKDGEKVDQGLPWDVYVTHLVRYLVTWVVS